MNEHFEETRTMQSFVEQSASVAHNRRPVAMPVAISYVIAVSAVLVATVLRLGLDPVWRDRYPYFLFLLAVIVVGRYGGLGPGIVTTLLSLIPAAYFWLEPRHSLAIGLPPDRVGTALFIGLGLAISLTNEAWRRQTRRVTELLQREHDARALFDAIDDAIYEVDADMRIKRWNHAAERLYGYSAAEAIGRSSQELLRPNISVAERAANVERIERGEVVRFEAEFHRKDGVSVWVNVTAVAKRNAAGTLASIVSVHRDVTERRKADERFRLVVDAAPTAILVVSSDGHIELVNHLAEELFGYERDELMGLGIEELIPTRVRGAHAGHRSGFLDDPRPRPMGVGRDLYALRKDGKEVPVEIGLSPVHTAEATFVLAAVSDITERKRVIEMQRESMVRAEELNRMKDRFLATLSHELRTPINAILGYAQLLSIDALPPDRMTHALTAIERNAQTQARLIESLLDLSRLEAGKLELQIEQVDLTSVVMRALDVIRPAADAKDLLVHADAPEGGVRIAGDADRLQQVVWNLLGNSVKFTPAGGRIDVRLMQTDGSAQIVVTDTGKGMSREFLPHAFERFRQGAHSGADPAAGLGIGLALVRELVEAHGGSVDASSAGDGHGSTFTVTLPLRGLPQQSLPAPMPSLEAIDIPSFTK